MCLNEYWHIGSRAAKLLGLANYQTFDNWMKKYGLD